MSSFTIPEAYLDPHLKSPPFWLTRTDELRTLVPALWKEFKIKSLGKSAGNRDIWLYEKGMCREGTSSSSASGALSIRDLTAYQADPKEKKVLISFAGIHGSEFEGIVLMHNLIHILETGKDLRGRLWPELINYTTRLDRILIIPILNPDGRARLPYTVEPYFNDSHEAHWYLTTGAWADGTQIGWPDCKRYIPLDFTKTAFPGGYPNDNGVNLQHDDFTGRPQPETRLLLDLLSRERPDLTMNWHTGAPPDNYFTRLHNEQILPQYGTWFANAYRAIHTRLTREGLQSSRNLEVEADPKSAPKGAYNLNTIINLHCGALPLLIEQPCHGFSGKDRTGGEVKPDMECILDQGIYTFMEAARLLVETGGACNWIK